MTGASLRLGPGKNILDCTLNLTFFVIVNAMVRGVES